MRAVRPLILLFLTFLLPLSSQAAQISGVELSTLEGQEVLVFRTSGNVAAPASFSRDRQAGVVSFSLQAEGAMQPELAGQLQGQLIRKVSLESEGDSLKVHVSLARPELADPSCFRFSSPSRHLVLFEVFEQAEVRREAKPLNIDEWIKDAREPVMPGARGGQGERAEGAAIATPRPASTGVVADELGIPTLQLHEADPQRVLGLAADSGLLNLRGQATISSGRLGSVSVKPSGQSLMSWTGHSPPDEVYLAGSPEQIAKFLQYAEPRFINGQPTLREQWAKARPQAASKPVMGGRSSATRSRIKDDPHGGLYYQDYQPGGLSLSDTRVTLDASNGVNLYDVLNWLSELSGISLIIDPYAFDEPTGGKREPLEPEGSDPDNDAGFRGAGIFQGAQMRPGSVRGNFVNVPFDQFLEMVLETHNLVYAVQSGGSSDSGRGDASRTAGRGTGRDSYEKPVILVTSPQRLEYELSGTNDINFYQFHYADPGQVAQLLQQFGVMPDMNSGWYIYRGGSNGNGGFGQGGNGSGGFNGGGGGNNGRGTQAAAAKPDVLVYRGEAQEEVLKAVRHALGSGQSVVRIVLSPDADDNGVTLFASSGRKR